MPIENINELDIGASNSGLTEYIDALKLDIEAVKNKMNEEIDEVIIPEVRKMWVGVSEERYETHLTTAKNEILEDIDNEYTDLKNRITDVGAYFYNQDGNMIEE